MLLVQFYRSIRKIVGTKSKKILLLIWFYSGNTPDTNGGYAVFANLINCHRKRAVSNQHHLTF